MYMYHAITQAPTVDGVELTQKLVHQSTQHPDPDIPVLAGANLDEGTEFMAEASVGPLCRICLNRAILTHLLLLIVMDGSIVLLATGMHGKRV